MNNIFKLRKKLNLDQKTLAEQTGFSRSYLGALENGRKRLNEDSIQKISKALGVNPEDLIKDDDKSLDFLYEIYNNNIKKYRLKSGLNQKELANMIGKSRTLIAGLENGKIRPTNSNLEQISKALNVSVNDLLQNNIQHKMSIEIMPNKHILFYLRNKLNITVKDLSDITGITQTDLKNIESNNMKPSLEDINIIATALKIRPEEIITTNIVPEKVYTKEDKIIHIPMYNHPLSAGKGMFTFEEENFQPIKILESILEEMSISNSKNLIAFKINGNSMEPTLKPNDTAFLDKTINYINGEGIYAFTYGETDNLEFYIKRMQKIPNKLLIISDNPIYENWDIKLPNNHIKIIGKLKFSINLNKLDY